MDVLVEINEMSARIGRILFVSPVGNIISIGPVF